MSEKTYELVEYLGKGGMGEVYRGVRHGAEGFRRQVAVKRLRASMALDFEARQRFVKEAQLTAALSHPNIVPVFDYYKDDKGRVCLVMAYVEGIDLAGLMDGARFAIPVIVHIVGSVLEGLAHAHQHGIIHRDIKPGNILISRGGMVQITDFGLAQDTGEAGDGGTAGYMSPEAVQGWEQDARSDLFSVGAVLYELLTGKSAFPGAHRTERLGNTIANPPPPPAAICPEVPETLSEIAMRLLRIEPSDRFASARAVLDALPAVKYGGEDLAVLVREQVPAAPVPAVLSSQDQISTQPYPAGAADALLDPAKVDTARILEPIPQQIAHDPDCVVAMDASGTGQPGRKTRSAPGEARPALRSIPSAHPAEDAGGSGSTPAAAEKRAGDMIGEAAGDAAEKRAGDMIGEAAGDTAEKRAGEAAEKRAGGTTGGAAGDAAGHGTGLFADRPGPTNEPRPGPANESKPGRTRALALVAVAALVVLCGVIGRHMWRSSPKPAAHESAGDVAPAPAALRVETTPAETPAMETPGAAITRPETPPTETPGAASTESDPAPTETPVSPPMAAAPVQQAAHGRRTRPRPRADDSQGPAPPRWHEVPIGTDSPWDVPIQRGSDR